MLHPTVKSLFAFAFAMILDLRVADAAAIPTDLYLSRYCFDCMSLMNVTSTLDLDGPIRAETTTNDFTTAKSYGELYWEDLGENLLGGDTEIQTFINAQLGSQTSDLAISVEYRDQHQGNNGCTYLESKLRDPSRVPAECGNLEPASDYFELVSVFTLTAVSVISFAVLAGVWLLRRFYRNWQLRNIILRAKATSNLQIGRGR